MSQRRSSECNSRYSAQVTPCFTEKWPMNSPIDELQHLMATLRDPQKGCPWDQMQTFQTIAPYTLEEAYEVADAISRQHWDDLRDELGDLLLQVVFHGQMAKELGKFDFDDIATAICEKLIRRHPHVFGDAQFDDLDELHRAWETIKASEKPQLRASTLAGIPHGLPAIIRALKLQKRAAKIGFDWLDVVSIIEKVTEELGEVRECLETNQSPEALQQELGDLLFACINLCRKLDCDPEMALMQTNLKFERRIRQIEQLANQPLSELTELQREALWQQVKSQEKQDKSL